MDGEYYALWKCVYVIVDLLWRVQYFLSKNSNWNWLNEWIYVCMYICHTGVPSTVEKFVWKIGQCDRSALYSCDMNTYPINIFTIRLKEISSNLHCTLLMNYYYCIILLLLLLTYLQMCKLVLNNVLTTFNCGDNFMWLNFSGEKITEVTYKTDLSIYNN
jgi:hypothetical protein